MGKGLNPADAFRKQEKKQQIARDKKQKAALKEVRGLLNDPDKVDAEMARVAKELQGNLANKTLKDRLKELQRMKEVALMKRKREDLLRRPENITGQAPEPSQRPEESIYFHPQFNPTGAPPPPITTPLPVFGLPGVPPPPPGPPSGWLYGQRTIPMGGVGGVPPPPSRAASALSRPPPQRREAQVSR